MNLNLCLLTLDFEYVKDQVENFNWKTRCS